MAVKTDPYVRFLRTSIERHGECLLWQGNLNNSGYCSIRVGKKVLGAHRFVYTKWHGEIPEGKYVDHTCHNEAAIRGECAGGKCYHRRCVNPAHLRAVSQGENLTASPLYGRARGEGGRRRTRCPQGHEYSEENTHVAANGWRSCRLCANEGAYRKRRARNPLVGTRGNGLKTHCPRGHEYTEINTYLRPDGRGRACRTCRRSQCQ